MLRSILVITFRKILKNPSYSLITIFGLTIGITTAILVFLWARYELTFDRYASDNERVYAVMINELEEGSIETYDETPVPLMEKLSFQIPEVEAVTRFDNTRAQLKVESKEILRYGAYADSGYFKVFSPEIIAGSIERPLSGNQSIAIAQTISKTLFGNENPIGKVITIGVSNDFAVSAVFKDFPENSSLHQYSFILPFNAKVRSYDDWQNYFVKLFDPTSKHRVETKIDNAIHEFMQNKNASSLLFPLTDWRLHWNFENGKVSGGRITYVVIFIITGIFILIMACVNYINIATASAAQRAKEIGVRKMTGATQILLARQFFTESVFLTFLATALSLILSYFTLPFFNQLTGLFLRLDISDPIFITSVFLLALMTSVIAGSYPAFLLARLKPALTLKGNATTLLTGAGLRRVLVVFQFTLSIILIFAAVVMRQQTSFLLNKDLGYDKKNIINIWVNHAPGFPLATFKSEILQHSSIVGAAYGGASPMEVNGSAEVKWPTKTSVDPVLLNGVSADHDMLSMLNFKFVAGRNFSPTRASDSSAFIITESAARKMGFTDPIGQTITYTMFGEKEGTIIGVIRDFHNEDIHAPIDPVIFQMASTDFMNNLFVRYEDGKLPQALADIKNVFNKFQPGIAINYSFLDEDFENQFFRERFLNTLSLWFTLIAISIAALGLLGLTLFNNQRMRKQIGVRKILGASVSQIYALLCSAFMKPVLISFAIAFPLAYLLAQKFLEEYAFRIELSFTLFLSVGVMMILFVLITVSFQSLSAALRRPVDVLKSE